MDLGIHTNIYIVVTLVIPIVFLGCFSPLYMAVDRFRSRHKEEKDFQNRWLYNGSTETGICALSLGLMLSFGTSQSPSNNYLVHKPSVEVHKLEMFSLGIAVLFIVIVTFTILLRYGFEKEGKNGTKQMISASLATLTLIPPTLFYFVFRMEWKIV